MKICVCVNILAWIITLYVNSRVFVCSSKWCRWNSTDTMSITLSSFFLVHFNPFDKRSDDAKYSITLCTSHVPLKSTIIRKCSAQILHDLWGWCKLWTLRHSIGTFRCTHCIYNLFCKVIIIAMGRKNLTKIWSKAGYLCTSRDCDYCSAVGIW